MRRYAFEAVANMRDLGGHPLPGGQETKYGRYIRCDAPVRMTDQELATLRAMGITTIIDLRAPEEIAKVPCAFDGAPGFDYHPIEAYLGNTPPMCEADVPLLYFAFADEGRSMARVMRCIANAQGGVLYHCSAGKDRTGVVSALLLLLAGVPVVDVLADYQVSYTYLREIIRKMHEEIKDFPLFMGHSKWEYMDGFLDLLFEKYGDARSYLQVIGLQDDEIERIEKKLTE